MNLHRLITANPTPQTALDIFEGHWVSKLPEPYSQYQAGETQLFNDARVYHLKDVVGKSILDLGPLEGGIAYTLEKMGATKIVSVEASTLLYLKCLVIKEILGMKNTQFLCGDAIEYLKNTTEKFDICIASGILYHMMDPIELLWNIAKKADQVLLWTHYFTEEPILNNITTFREATLHSAHDILFKYHLQEYGVAFKSNIYCGGTTTTSNWMSREDILFALNTFGFTTVNVIDDSISVNGPVLFLIASK